MRSVVATGVTRWSGQWSRCGRPESIGIEGEFGHWLRATGLASPENE